MIKVLTHATTTATYINDGGVERPLDDGNKPGVILDRNTLAGLSGDCTNLRGNFSNIRGDLSGLRGTVSEALKGDVSNLTGDCSKLTGDCSYLTGDCTGVVGNCSGLSGNIDTAGLTENDRVHGVSIAFLADGTL